MTSTSGNGITPIYHIEVNDTFAAVVDFRGAALQALIQRWTNPEFWKEKGCRMDSLDCAQELRVALGELP